MIVLNIDVTRIPRERIVAGKKGKYIDLVLHENKNGQDQYGNDGFVSMSVSKEERAQNVRGEIIGNWKNVGQKTQQREERQQPPQRRQSEPQQRQQPPLRTRNQQHSEEPDIDF